jgi:hypothetical protein
MEEIHQIPIIDSETVDILPSLHPPLTRNISHNVSDQGKDGSCYSHSVARVFLKYFKVEYLDKTNIPGKRDSTIIQQNNKCDDLYLNPNLFCSLDDETDTECVINIFEICAGNEYEYLCVLLYMFFYTLVIKHTYELFDDINGAFVTSSFNYIMSIIYSLDIIQDLNNSSYCYSLQEGDCNKIQELLLANFHNKNDIIVVGSEKNLSYERDKFEDIIEETIDAGLYLSLSLSGHMIVYRTKHPGEQIPQEIFDKPGDDGAHVVTIVDFDGSDVICKNSWGKTDTKFGLIPYSIDELEAVALISIAGLQNIIGGDESLYSLVIRHLPITDFLSSKTSAYINQNLSNIQYSIKYAINTASYTCFVEILDILNTLGIEILLDDITIFDYICFSNTSIVDPTNIPALLRVLFRFYRANKIKIPKKIYDAQLKFLLSELGKDPLDLSDNISEIFDQFQKDIVEYDPDDLWDKYTNGHGMSQRGLAIVFDYYNVKKKDRDAEIDELFKKYTGVNDGLLDKDTFIKLIQDEILNKKSIGGSRKRKTRKTRRTRKTRSRKIRSKKIRSRKTRKIR